MKKQETLPKLVRKFVVGKVTGVGLSKTIKVKVYREVAHPIYKKILRRTQQFLVHREEDQSVVIGDTVEIVETAPISKRKHFKLVRKI